MLLQEMKVTGEQNGPAVGPFLRLSQSFSLFEHLVSRTRIQK